MRFQSYFNTAILILRQYDGSMPLLHFLKQYFSLHKKHGSKDRKWITHLCYTYFRLGHALKNHPPENRLKAALFLCNAAVGEWQVLFDESWTTNWPENVQLRLATLATHYPDFLLADVFPWVTELSSEIDTEAFLLSHFTQPDLFLRVRPGKEKQVVQKLSQAGIPFRQMGTHCLALPNASKLNEVLEPDREVVVQDYSSQQVQLFFPLTEMDAQASFSLWDCCAASGGKSILAFDTWPKLLLTVSDLRPAILRNLKERFEKAGIRQYQSFRSDLSQKNAELPSENFRMILCDAPCSGSGTWGRTPEQLYYFSTEKITEFALLQSGIVKQVLNKLEPGGYFLYITCSVFKKENEEQMAQIEQQGFDLVKASLLKGYTQKADSMFAALFQKKIR